MYLKFREEVINLVVRCKEKAVNYGPNKLLFVVIYIQMLFLLRIGDYKIKIPRPHSCDDNS